MVKPLTATISGQISDKAVAMTYALTVGGSDYSAYLLGNWSISASRKFGASSASFTLNNTDSRFGAGGDNVIKVGDVVTFTEKFTGDSTTFTTFYGLVKSRTIAKSSNTRTITLLCLDYLSVLQDLSLDLDSDGTRVTVTDEVLTPVYLADPNGDMAQLFNFSNTGIANAPIPFIRIRNKDRISNVDTQYDGFEIYYDVGQLKLGAPLNVRNNYEVLATYCYSDDTEVLTEKGWILIKDIVDKKQKIKIATLNSDKNIVEYHYPENYFNFKIDEPILYQKGKRIDFQVTSNHNVWCRTLNKKKRNKLGFEFYKAKDLPRYVEYKKDFPYEGEEKQYFILKEYKLYFNDRWKKNNRVKNFKEKNILMDDWLEFFGWYLSEGNLRTKNEICISQYNSVNKTKVDKIKKCLDRLGFKYNYYDEKVFILWNPQLANYLKQFGKSHDKFIPREFLNLSKRQLNIIVNSLMLGDGSGDYYSSVSKKLIDNVQELFLKTGNSSNVYKNNLNIYVAHKDKRNISQPNKTKDNREWVHYSGKVYCIEVPNNLIYVRRNGKGCWSGNSYYVKGVYAEDIIESILKETDGYDRFLFGETSAQAVVDNHLIDNLNNVTGSSIDTMVPNTSAKTIVIETTLNGDITAETTSIVLADATGFPTSGEASINGDTFTWTGVSTNTLTGVPATGSYALKAHNSGDYVKYSTSYAIGKVWYLTYDNLTTTLATGNFTVSGASIDYIDKRFGRILLDTAISIGATVTCDVNYSFKTLQATGIEINRMTFREREVKNRFKSITKVKKYVAPNYVIMTKGDGKIWAEYLNQKTNADYSLSLETSLNYSEDTDLFTRVDLWGKNKQPTNIMFGDDIDYTSDAENSYTGIANKVELAYFGVEKSGVLSSWADTQKAEAELLHNTETSWLIAAIQAEYINKEYATQVDTGKHIFGATLSGSGKIILGDIVPVLYINGVPIDNQAAQQTAVPVKITQTVDTITEGGGKSKSVSVTSYYYYTIIFAHVSIIPSEPIYLYDNQGILQYTIAGNDPNMDYSKGVWTLPGMERNSLAETISTGTYKVLYSTDSLDIRYDDAVFAIDRSILPDPEEALIEATFEYWAIAINVKDIAHLVDGRRDTQLQLEFYGEPPIGFHLATIDLGASYNIQAIDIIGGFFKPDRLRRFDVGFKMSMKSSTDNISFETIGDKTERFELEGGEAVSFEEEELGTGFTARYLKFELAGVDKIDYGKGRYVVALTEISVYTDIVIKSETKLISTTQLSSAAETGDSTVNVVDTSGFTSTGTAYISIGSFTYSGITDTTFTGCSLSVGIDEGGGTRVSQTLESDTTLYDDDGLLPGLGDRVSKLVKVSDRNLYLSSELDALSKSFLREYYKNHSKVKASVIFAPYLQVGQTVALTDSYNSISSNYFIESIRRNPGTYNLVLAKYPA